MEPLGLDGMLNDGTHGARCTHYWTTAQSRGSI